MILKISSQIIYFEERICLPWPFSAPLSWGYALNSFSMLFFSWLRVWTLKLQFGCCCKCFLKKATLKAFVYWFQLDSYRRRHIWTSTFVNLFAGTKFGILVHRFLECFNINRQRGTVSSKTTTNRHRVAKLPVNFKINRVWYSKSFEVSPLPWSKNAIKI